MHDHRDLVEWRYLLEERIGMLLNDGMPEPEAEVIGREIVEQLYRDSKGAR